MAIRLAVANQKGGVGKTTSVMMAAEGLALFAGLRVLVIDFDPQGMISKILIGQQRLDELRQEGRTLIDLLKTVGADEAPGRLRDLIVAASDIKELRDAHDGRRVSLVATHPALLAEYGELMMELPRNAAGARPDDLVTQAMARELADVEQDFDVIIFDCPAGPSMLTLAALQLCPIILAPTVLEKNSLSALSDFLSYMLKSHIMYGSKAGGRVHLLMTMFLRSNPSQQMLLEHVQRGFASLNAIPNPVPHSTALQRASSHPGRGHYRLAKEKYGASYEDLRQLTQSLHGILFAGRAPQRPEARATDVQTAPAFGGVAV